VNWRNSKAVTAEPKVYVFSRYENAQETGFCTDIPSSSQGITKWFSSVFLVPLRLRNVAFCGSPTHLGLRNLRHGTIKAKSVR
jgi:hypothetical protein